MRRHAVQIFGSILASAAVLFPAYADDCEGISCKCMDCEPGPSISRPDNDTPVYIPAPDPRQIALQNAIARFTTLVRSLSGDSNDLDKSWLNLPLGTEEEFFNAANKLHEFLVNEADGNRFRVAHLQEELASLNHVTETYPSLIATHRAGIEAMLLERDRLTVALTNEELQLELTNRTSKQIEARASFYEDAAKAAKRSIQDWFTVLLPPSIVKATTPQPYGSALDWAPSVLERQRPQQAMEEPQSIQPAQAVASRLGFVRIPISPMPFTGSVENAAAQLDTAASELKSAKAANTWDLANQADALQPVASQLEQELIEATQKHDGLASEVKSLAGKLNEANWVLLGAQDNLKAAEESFVYRAAEAWIWERAKTEAIEQVKTEAKRLVEAKWIGAAYRDVSDDEMHRLLSAGKQNIFDLADKALSSKDALNDVVTRINTLQTHGEGYIQEAVRIAALGSPQQMLEYVDAMFKELGDDSEQLVKANFGAMNIPDPWKSIAAKLFIKEAAE